MTDDGVVRVVNSGKESEFEWKIDNFLHEKVYRSPGFKFEGESWNFFLDSSYIYDYIFLQLSRSSDSPIEVEFSVSLKNTEGTKRFERRERKYISTPFYDIHKWINRNEFFNRQTEFLSSGCLTILLTMKKTDSGESESESGALQPSGLHPKDKIAQDLKKILLNQENCDVVLIVQGQEFSAHQVILTARSPVFASTFRNNMREKETGRVDIEDVDPSRFSEFLCFLYCGEVDKLTAENVHSLFCAADKYQIMDLRTMCLEFMKDNLSVDTFCETLLLALLHTETDLINSCTDYFVRNAEEILVTVKWQTFIAENPTQSNELIIKYVKHVKQFIK